MVDVFISYSRSDQEKVGNIARMIASEGYQVWWDADLPPHMSYGDVITAKIGAAKAAVVVWSHTAAASEWVRAEADVARNQKKLIQTALDDIIPPLPFNQIQCAMLGDWNGEPDHPGWSKVRESLIALCGPRGANQTGEVSAPPTFAAPPPSPPPAPAPAPTQSNVPLIAGIAVALIAIVAAVVIVFVALGRSEGDAPAIVAAPTDAPDTPPAEEDAEPDAAPAAPTPVPDRREWLSATVEDADGFSNVRARPTTGSAIVGTVREGETFSTWRQDGSWWQVELSDGTRGFIFRRLIRLTGSDGAGAQVPGDANGMIFADSSTRRLTNADLAGLNVGTLRIARNEIYARRGYRFADDALRSYFTRFSWYSPRYDNVTLTPIEQDNVALIRSTEASLGR